MPQINTEYPGYFQDELVEGVHSDEWVKGTHMPLRLTAKSKVTISMRSLNFANEDWTALVDWIMVYDKTKLDKVSGTRNITDCIVFEKNNIGGEVGTSTFSISFTLPAGNYYIPININSTSLGMTLDTAFKYTVTQVAGLSTPKITQVYQNDKYVSGTCVKNSTVTVTVGGKDYTTSDTADGKFKVKVPSIKTGTEVSVKLTKGKDYSKTATTKAIADSFINAKLTSCVTVKNGDTIVSGKCYPGTTVSVKVGSKTYKDTTTTTGKYSIKVPTIKKGTTIKITQKNKTNSKSRSLENKVSFLNITSVTYTSKGYKVKGTCKKNQDVKITVGSKTYTTKKTSDGTFSITIPNQKAGTAITISQGNGTITRRIQGGSRLLLQYYKPNVVFKTNGYTVSGRSLAKGATVYVKVGSKTYKGTVDDKGNYKVKTSKITKGTKVSVYVKSSSVTSKTTTVKAK